MGGVYLSEGKNGGSILRCRKKWGEDTLAAEGRVYLHTPPPRGNFGSFPKCIFMFIIMRLSKQVKNDQLWMYPGLGSLNESC